LWDEMLPTLDRTLARVDRHDQLPEQAWIGEDQASNQAEIDALLDEAITILTGRGGSNYRRHLRELEEKIARAQADIAAARQKRVSAPRDSLWRETVEGYDRLIEERSRDIHDYQQRLVAVRQQFADELRQVGLTVDDGQLEFLLSTVIGDDIIELGVAFDNVKALTEQLEGLMVEGGLDSGRRYYGMYTVLLRVLARMHQRLLEAVEQRYLPQIDTIARRARELAEETRALLDKATAAERPLLSANRQAQELTLRTAGLYRDYLLDQARQVAAAAARLERDIRVADNTYQTVKVSGELVGLIRDSRRLLDALLHRQVPPLRTFDNLEMKQEFEKLTARLRAGE
ncbi:MAG: hypothetical protein R3310_14100, partial [Candidatus Competibacteraceae bacterium]|nr:hypothetical protein [Candidatus Competibacteraceae bacterium]